MVFLNTMLEFETYDESPAKLENYVTALEQYLSLGNDELKPKLTSLGWIDESNQLLFKILNPSQIQQAVEVTLDLIKSNSLLQKSIEEGLTKQDTLNVISEFAKQIWKNAELILAEPVSLDAFVSNHGLYNISLGKDIYNLDNHQITRFLKRKPAYLFGESQTAIATKLKEELILALAEDIRTYDGMSNQALPIFNNEKFNLVEAEIQNPYELIDRSLKHIRELLISMNGFSINELLLQPVTKGMLGTGTWLQEQRYSSKVAQETFNYLIERFWPDHVGRFTIKKGKPGQDESLIELAKPDKVIDQEGYFPVNKAVNKDFSDRLHCFGATAWSTLRTQIITRREDYDNGVSVSPLPQRKKEGYWVVIEDSLDDAHIFRKLRIPWDIIAGPEANFEDFFKYFEMAYNAAFVVEDLQTQDRIEQLLKQDISYDSPEHKNNRKDFLNVVDADLRITIDKLSPRNKGVKHLLNNPVYNPVGSRTPTVISLMALPLNDSKNEKIKLRYVNQISSHRFADGAYIEGSELNNIIAGIISDLNIVPNEKRTTLDFPVYLEPEDIEVSTTKFPVYEIMLGSEELGRNKQIDLAYANTMKQLYDICRPESMTYQYYLKEYGIRLNIYSLFNMALLDALGIKHAHFLEKDGDSITPVPVVLPLEMAKLIKTIRKHRTNITETFYSFGGSKSEMNYGPQYVEKNTFTDEKANEVNLKKIAKGLQLFADGRYKHAKRQKIGKNGKYKIGAGDIEVLSVAAGPGRSFLSGVASFSIPGADEIVTDSLLISCLTKSSEETRSFGSALDSIYKKWGSIGVSNLTDSAWRIVFRSGEENLLRKKFDPKNTGKSDTELEQLFKEQLQNSLYCVLNGLSLTAISKNMQQQRKEIEEKIEKAKIEKAKREQKQLPNQKIV